MSRKLKLSIALGCGLAWLVATFSAAFLPLKEGAGLFTRAYAALPWLDGWIRWDARWYEAIATSGYFFAASDQSPIAYFPLYPLAMRAVAALGVPALVAGVALTLLSGLAALVLFRRWAATLATPGQADAGTALLALYPFAFFLYGPVYSDALFLLLIVSAFWMIESDRPWAAALLGALATATRPVAPAVVVGLLARQLERRWRAGERLRPRDFVPALSALGLATFMAYQWIAFGTPLAFVQTQSAWGQTPGLRTWLKLDFFTDPRFEPYYGVAIPHALIALGCLALALPTARRLGYAYGLYVAIAIGLPLLSSGAFVGLGRYALAAFPCFLTLALLLEPRPRARALWLAVSVALLVVMTSRFAVGRYVS